MAVSGRVVPVAASGVVHPECGDPRPQQKKEHPLSPAQPNERHTRPPHRRAIVAAAVLTFATIGIAAAAAASADSAWTVTTEVEVDGRTGTWPAPEAKAKGKLGSRVAPAAGNEAAPADEAGGHRAAGRGAGDRSDDAGGSADRRAARRRRRADRRSDHRHRRAGHAGSAAASGRRGHRSAAGRTRLPRRDAVGEGNGVSRKQHEPAATTRCRRPIGSARPPPSSRADQPRP